MASVLIPSFGISSHVPVKLTDGWAFIDYADRFISGALAIHFFTAQAKRAPLIALRSINLTAVIADLRVKSIYLDATLYTDSTA